MPTNLFCVFFTMTLFKIFINICLCTKNIYINIYIYIYIYISNKFWPHKTQFSFFIKYKTSKMTAVVDSWPSNVMVIVDGWPSPRWWLAYTLTQQGGYWLTGWNWPHILDLRVQKKLIYSCMFILFKRFLTDPV